jgi:hypothetical protein
MFDKTNIQGHNEDSEWLSDQSIIATSAEWRPSYNTGWLKLCYVSDEQLASLRNNFPSVTEMSGPNDIKYFGDTVQAGEEGCGGGADNLPLYWQFNDSQPVLILCYLSDTMIGYLKQNDLHNADLANKNYFGPSQVQCFSIGKINISI